MVVGPKLQFVNVTKKFGELKVLQEINLTVTAGSIHIITGENGAGKSTLAKIMGGVYQPDHGDLIIDGEKVRFREPADARAHGVHMLHQDCTLIEQMNVAENLFLNQEPRGNSGLGRYRINHKQLYEEADKLLSLLPVKIDARLPVSKLGLAQKRLIEILRAYYQNPRILILDEPSASLNRPEAGLLYKLIRELQQRGVTIVYITSLLEEVFTLGEQVSVLQDGVHIGTFPVKDIEYNRLLTYFAGADYKERYPKLRVQRGDEILHVEQLVSEDILDRLSFSLHRGEILGLTGSAGSGRTNLARILFGLGKVSSGVIYLDGKKTTFRNARDAIKAGICFITEDREQEGIFPLLSLKENITISDLSRVGNGFFLNRHREERIAEFYKLELGITKTGSDVKAGNLSSGMKQKLLLARWLYKNSRIFILDEPTKGVDISSKIDIYNILNELVLEGAAVLLISSDLKELLGMSDRILVLNKGRLVANLVNTPDLNQQKLMDYLAQ